MAVLIDGYLDACSALALLVLLSGPDFAAVTRFALSGSFDDGLRAATGVTLGLLGWGLATALGPAALLAASAALFDAVRLLGAVYLLAMGIALPGPERPGWLDHAVDDRPGCATIPDRLDDQLAEPEDRGLLHRRPAVAGSAAAPAVPRLALLALTHVALSFLWLTALAALAARGRCVLGRPRSRRIVEAITGTALVGFGLALARTSR